mgnify:CR=1 FL=1
MFAVRTFTKRSSTHLRHCTSSALLLLLLACLPRILWANRSSTHTYEVLAVDSGLPGSHS